MEEDHRSIQTQLLEIRHESLTFKIKVPSWPVSSTGRALHWYCTGQKFESYSSLNFSGFLFATAKVASITGMIFFNLTLFFHTNGEAKLKYVQCSFTFHKLHERK